MFLAHVIHECEDLMICDLAQQYGILDYRTVSPLILAALVSGLGRESRVMRYLTGEKLTLNEYLLAHMADSLAFIAWSRTKAAEKGHGRPESLLMKLLGKDKASLTEDLLTFDTPEDYEAWLASRRGKDNG